MAVTGALITAFILLHLQHFRFATPIIESGSRDLYHEVVNTLQDPVMAAVYLIACALVGLHMFYGWDRVL